MDSIKGKVIWKTPFLIILWIIWKERNSRCFDSKAMEVEALIDKLKFITGSCISVLPLCHSISFNLLVNNWSVVTLVTVGMDVSF